MSIRASFAALTISVTLAVGCASKAQRLHVQQWGTMYEVLREGKAEGRVGLGELTHPETVGVGALERLAGEVMIVNGEVWTARVEDGEPVATQVSDPGAVRAALLIAARVPRWRVVAIDSDVAPGDFEALLAAAIDKNGLSHESVVPFMVEGPLAAVEMHVVNGRCPQAGETADPTDDAYRGAWARARGTIVGFFAEDRAGVLTHHTSRVHAHALLVGPTPMMGHADRIGLRPGAMLMLPIGD
jgi:alpha-acetolactate decarboxylase